DKVESLLLARQVAACLVIDKSHRAIPLQMAREVAETLVDHVEDVAIDFHRQDTLLPEQLSRQHVPPAPRADDCNPGTAAQVVHEVGEVPPEKIDFCDL